MAHIQLQMPFHYIWSTPYTCLTCLTFTAIFMPPYLNLSSLMTKQYSPHKYVHIRALSSQRKGRSGLLTRLSIRENVAGVTNIWCGGGGRGLRQILGYRGQRWRNMKHWTCGWKWIIIFEILFVSLFWTDHFFSMYFLSYTMPFFIYRGEGCNPVMLQHPH